MHIELRRRGYEQLIPLDVTRDEVYIPTVPAAFMIDSTTAYIKLQDFGENTDRDLKRALHDLAGKGMRRLVLDIRGNPGGPLDQAIKVANEFLPKGKMIVYTRGRISNSDQDYRATEDSEFTDVPIVMIANRNSASASEIVTGALQDHDRAYVVGETTFGKALVQSVYRISGGAGPRAHDGALLHAERPAHSAPVGRDLRRVPQLHAARSGHRAHAQPERPEAHRLGRPVYSGGGIEPDKRIAGPVGPGSTGGFNVGRFGRMLNSRQAFANYAQKYAAEGDTRVAQQSTGRKIVKPNFVVDDAIVADFREQLKNDGIKIDEAGFAQGSRVHQGDDPLRDRQRRVRHRRRAAPPDRRRSAGADRAVSSSAKPEAQRAQQRNESARKLH